AVRAEDGRGEPTALLDAVRAHFGATTLAEAVARLHLSGVAFDPNPLCPLLFEVAAAGDAVARSVVDRLVEEVALLAGVSLTRLGLPAEPVDVVLGGGVLTGTGGVVVDAVAARLAEIAPAARVRVVDVPPVVGAALLGLDAVGAAPGAENRLRAEHESAGSHRW
ncbi:MAG: ATPase, partial [Saccharothrix sp.]|nr:ATPase [Saccharothrix sp.]